MKKILILALTAVASLGLTFGTALAFRADETYISDLDDLKGATITWADTLSGVAEFNLTMDFTTENDVSCTGFNYNSENDRGTYDGYTSGRAYDEGTWGEGCQTISVDIDTTISFISGGIDVETTMEDLIAWLNNNIQEFTPYSPAETPTMWQAILSGIGGFFSGMFSLLSGLFSGVVAVFYTNNTTTIILQALIFAAAAGLVSAAVYVIVRLIKSAIARLRGGVGGAGGYYINDKRVSRFAFKRNILKEEGREGLRSWKSKNKRYRRLLRLRRK